MATAQHVYCPDCGSKNDLDARFCDACGRALDDVRQTVETSTKVTVGDEKDSEGRLLADDRRPVGDDPEEYPGGERLIWQGRPSKLWSPRMALTQRYKLTSQRLIMTFGFIGRRTEEIDLYRVNDVGVKQHPLERITRMGDIFIASADTSSPTKYLHNIETPDRVKDLIREAARVERQRRRVLLREEF
jgi:hypothetical protein